MAGASSFQENELLKQRIITAVVLLLILIPAIVASNPLPFAALMLLAMGAAAWEWARLNGLKGAATYAVAAACLALCGLAWWQGWTQQSLPSLWLVAGGAWFGLASLVHWAVSTDLLGLAPAAYGIIWIAAAVGFFIYSYNKIHLILTLI